MGQFLISGLQTLISLLIGGFVGVILTTIFQKDFDRKYADLRMWWRPEPIVFEATRISGCSGGELGRLVDVAKIKGLQTDSQIRNSFLCAIWSDRDEPRRILENIATRFDSCFVIDSSQTTPNMELKIRDTNICTANLDLDNTNQWTWSNTRQIYVCNFPDPKSLVQVSKTPSVQACSKSVLQSLGFQK